MRIRKNKLGTPDYEYVTVLKGKWVKVGLYHEPEYCVQVTTEKGSQCYPLTVEQYDNYCDNAMMVLYPSEAVLGIMLEKARRNIAKFDGDKSLKKFWTNVRDHYQRRLELD